MPYSFKPSFSRAIALFGLLGLGLAQVGCAHPVYVEPAVVVHSRVGQYPVYAQVGVPGPVIYAPPPRVIYTPPPPRVVYVPRVVTPGYEWGHGHERRWGYDRREGGRGERHDDHRRHGGYDDWHR